MSETVRCPAGAGTIGVRPMFLLTGHFVSVSAGWAHTCAVDEGLEKVCVCWGRNDLGQSSPPPNPE